MPQSLVLVSGNGDVVTNYILVLFIQIYVSVPGSKKIILELPLVIGSRSGLSSRSSSMASQTSSEMSWVDLNIPDAPEGELSAMLL